jgi:hypothetical protein
MILPCVKRDRIKMIYGSTMFGKLWEWFMGIIAWIMSFFSRKSGGAVEQSEDAPQAEPTAELAQEPANSE